MYVLRSFFLKDPPWFLICANRPPSSLFSERLQCLWLRIFAKTRIRLPAPASARDFARHRFASTSMRKNPKATMFRPRPLHRTSFRLNSPERRSCLMPACRPLGLRHQAMLGLMQPGPPAVVISISSYETSDFDDTDTNSDLHAMCTLRFAFGLSPMGSK